jgi:hypothetical protein
MALAKSQTIADGEKRMLNVRLSYERIGGIVLNRFETFF